MDLQQAFAALLENFYPGYLTWDRVHPNEVGQLVIARQLMQAVEPLWADFRVWRQDRLQDKQKLRT